MAVVKRGVGEHQMNGRQPNAHREIVIVMVAEQNQTQHDKDLTDDRQRASGNHVGPQVGRCNGGLSRSVFHVWRCHRRLHGRSRITQRLLFECSFAERGNCWQQIEQPVSRPTFL